MLDRDTGQSTPTIDTVLSELNQDENLPSVFKKQAIIAADYLRELDANPETQNRGPQQLRKIAQRHLRILDGKSQLPTWLHKHESEYDETLAQRADEAFNSWVLRQGGKINNKGVGQDFYEGPGIDFPDEMALGPRRFKMYLAGNAMIDYLNNGQLSELLNRLKNAGTPPSGMKLYQHTALPIYFWEDIEKSGVVKEIFESLGIRNRGPAQDHWVVKVRTGKWERIGLNQLSSNDETVGDMFQINGAYSQGKFFRQMIDEAKLNSKRPDNPYLTSFVWIIDRGENPLPQNKIEYLMREGEPKVGYPLAYKHSPVSTLP